MGKKYIIEMEDKPFHKEDGDFLYRVKGFNSLVFDMTGIGKLTPYTEPDIEQVRKEAYERGYETAKHECEDCPKQVYTDAIRMEGYQKGLSDAWEAARKILEYDTTTLRKIFGGGIKRMDWFMRFTASEAIEKIRQYEQEKEEIHLGDEVTFLPNNAKGIVTECHVPDAYSDNDKYAVWCGGTMEYVLKQHLTKTGRHFPEIAEVMQKMKEEE